jgi:hypothetical protein
VVDASVSGYSRSRLTRSWNRVGREGVDSVKRCLYRVRVVVLPPWPWPKDLQLHPRPVGAGHCRQTEAGGLDGGA